jgi:hypothetical protein
MFAEQEPHQFRELPKTLKNDAVSQHLLLFRSKFVNL